MPTGTPTAASSPDPDPRLGPSPRQPQGGKQFGLPRSARILRRKDFSRIYARGLRAGGRCLVLVAGAGRGPGHRLGVSVSKAHGCAVVRNKIKRIYREAFRLERPGLPGCFDMILIPRVRSDKHRLDEVRQELRCLCRKVTSGKGRRRRKRR